MNFMSGVFPRKTLLLYNNTKYLLLGLYHALVNWISIVLMQITPQNELYYGIGEKD